MKKIIYSIFLFSLALGFASCDKYDDPTYDTVIYDESKTPIIRSLNTLPTDMMAEESFQWQVRIEAFNGIKDISINDEVVISYGDGQLVHEGSLEIIMPDDAQSLDVTLTVEDELGNVQSFPTATILSKGFIKSPYMIIDFLQGGSVLAAGDTARPTFPIANGESAAVGYTNNCGWFSTTVASDTNSDTGSATIRYGRPSMNTANNSLKWAEAVEFGVSDIFGSSEKSMYLRNHFTDAATVAGATVNNTKWKPMPPSTPSKIVFDNTLDATLVQHVVEGKRVFKMDIYVDTSASATADTNPDEAFNYDPLKHHKVALGMACVSRFNNSNSNGLKRSGQFGGVMAYISETDKWVTLEFSSKGNDENPFTEQSPTPIDPPAYNEVDMLTLYISPQSGEGNVASNAKYYIKNLRVEKVQ